MKKITTTIFALLMTVLVFGQIRTLQTVAYRGAFAPGVAAWTSTWTNFDPQTTPYPNAAGNLSVRVTKAITASTRWTKNKTYFVAGPIYVKAPAVLTIEAGTVIKGDTNAANSCLIISRGAKIMAQGTIADPIVFTSGKSAGNRNVGDWGGVIILGKARINATGGVSNVEGLATSADNEFGGTDDDDNSGVFSYCRIEFGGFIFSPDKEINGLTMAGVGRKTRIDHVQTSFINDDAFEWFGGSVNCTHLVSYRNVDDDMDTDMGFSGTVQFGLIIRDKNLVDLSTGSVSEGFESNGDPVGTNRSLTPRTTAVFSNFTCVGPFRNDLTQSFSNSSKFERALRIRANSSLRIFNSVFTDFNKGLQFDGTDAIWNAKNGLNNKIDSANANAAKYNVFASIKTDRYMIGANDSSYTVAVGGYPKDSILTPAQSIDSIFYGMKNSYQVASNGLFVDNISTSNFNMDYRPAVGTDSILAKGANFTDVFIASRTKEGISDAAILTPNFGDSVEIGTYTGVRNDTITCGSIAGADSYIWSTNALTGITFVSGQGTTSLIVNIAPNLAITAARPIKIYVQGFNSNSAAYSAKDSIKIVKSLPKTVIAALSSNPSNNLMVGAWESAPLAVSSNLSQKYVKVSSTTGLNIGMFVKVVAGTGNTTTAGNAGTNNVVDSIFSDTTFSLKNNITATLTPTTVLRAYYVPQGVFGSTSATYSAANVSSLATLVTVTSTTSLVEGMWLRKVSGTGTLKAGTVVAKVISSTQFVLSQKPTVDLANATIAAYPLLTNSCPVKVTSGYSSEIDYTVSSTTSDHQIGYKFDVPNGARICRVGANALTDYRTNIVKSISTTSNSIGVVFDSSFVTGPIKVTPYNNAGLSRTFLSITVKNVAPSAFKITSSKGALRNDTVIFRAIAAEGHKVGTYVWTLPSGGKVTALSGTVSGLTVTTTTDTLSLAFASNFITGSLKIAIANSCGMAAAKTFSLNSTQLTKTSGETELEEITEEVSNATSFNVYPNPNNGNFNINMTTENTEEVAQVTIINVLGQVVSSIAIPNNNGVINSEVNAKLSTGIYFVRVQLGSEINIAKISVN